jgi:aromatic ring hydroxylase
MTIPTKAMKAGEEDYAIAAIAPVNAPGVRKAVTNIQAGGGLYAQRIVTRRHYDLEAAKERALAVAGLGDGDGDH